MNHKCLFCKVNYTPKIKEKPKQTKGLLTSGTKKIGLPEKTGARELNREVSRLRKKRPE